MKTVAVAGLVLAPYMIVAMAIRRLAYPPSERRRIDYVITAEVAAAAWAAWMLLDLALGPYAKGGS